jgi:thioredoxin reductase (NADPH)
MGGQAGESSRIENYLGFPAGLSGAELARRATAQAQRLGAELLGARSVTGIAENGPARLVSLNGGGVIGCHSVLIATGVHYRRLGVPGSDELTGAGIYYGVAPAEAAMVAGEHVVVVGGANSAGQAAVHLAERARAVTILCRADALEKGMSHYLVERIRTLGNVEVRTGAEIAAVSGDGRLEEIAVLAGGREERLPAAAAFIFIGAEPQTEWLGDLVARDERGFILSGPAVLGLEGRHRWRLERDPLLLETSVPGVFVAGDVRDRSMKRVASAVGEGAMAVQLVHQYLGGIAATAAP